MYLLLHLLSTGMQMAHVILMKCGDLYFKLKAHSYHYIRLCTFPAITNTTLDMTPNVIQKKEEN